MTGEEERIGALTSSSHTLWTFVFFCTEERETGKAGGRNKSRGSEYRILKTWSLSPLLGPLLHNPFCSILVTTPNYDAIYEHFWMSSRHCSRHCLPSWLIVNARIRSWCFVHLMSFHTFQAMHISSTTKPKKFSGNFSNSDKDWHF